MAPGQVQDSTDQEDQEAGVLVVNPLAVARIMEVDPLVRPLSLSMPLGDLAFGLVLPQVDLWVICSGLAMVVTVVIPPTQGTVRHHFRQGGHFHLAALHLAELLQDLVVQGGDKLV
jgi:hypothetical protein